MSGLSTKEITVKLEAAVQAERCWTSAVKGCDLPNGHEGYCSYSAPRAENETLKAECEQLRAELAKWQEWYGNAQVTMLKQSAVIARAQDVWGSQGVVDSKLEALGRALARLEP